MLLDRENKLRPPISTLSNEPGGVLSVPADISDSLNDFLSSVFVKEQINKTLPAFNRRTDKLIGDLKFSHIEVRRMLQSLGRDNPMGNDMVHSLILKN